MIEWNELSKLIILMNEPGNILALLIFQHFFVCHVNIWVDMNFEIFRALSTNFLSSSLRYACRQNDFND